MKIYGPVPSWRLGNSLGVDLVEAPKGYSKICSFDCLYCQLGHKGLKTNEPRKVHITKNDFEILKLRIEATNPDYITFSGQGEPSLNLNLGGVAKRIKQMADIPLAVLTNASFIDNPELRKGLEHCDLVIAKLDAPTQELFEKINRPLGFRLANILRGIKAIKSNVAIQTLLFSYGNLTNADNETVNRMIELYNELNQSRPISIFLGTANRPTDIDGLKSISQTRLERIAKRISKATGIEVVYYQKTLPKPISRDISPEELNAEIMKLLQRRPCTEKEIFSRFGDPSVKKILPSLVKAGILKSATSKGNKYYFQGD